MSRLLLLTILLSLVLAGCVHPYHLQEAPRSSRRYYHHRQRLHERERRHTRPNLPWNLR